MANDDCMMFGQMHLLKVEYDLVPRPSQKKRKEFVSCEKAIANESARGAPWNLFQESLGRILEILRINQTELYGLQYTISGDSRLVTGHCGMPACCHCHWHWHCGIIGGTGTQPIVGLLLKQRKGRMASCAAIAAKHLLPAGKEASCDKPLCAAAVQSASRTVSQCDGAGNRNL